MYGSTPTREGVTAHETGHGKTRRTVLKFDEVVVPLIGDASHSARLALKVYDFPEGLITIKGAVVNLSATDDTAAVTDTQAGFTGLGTVAAAQDADTLATTTQNLATTTAFTAVAGVIPAKAAGPAAPVNFDGTGGAIDVYLNMLATAVGTAVGSAATNLTLNGTIEINWEEVGDK